MKTLSVNRRNGEFGFNVIGSAPVIVESVDEDGPAKVSSLSSINRIRLQAHHLHQLIDS